MLNAEGRAYRKAVNDQVTLQRIPRHVLTGKLAVEIIARPPDSRARDLDNLLKGILDALQHAAIVVNDSEIDDLHIRRGAVPKGGEIQIHIREIPGEATVTAPLFGSAA
jgi:crossover junction endodeoxyribonuclease RusA